MLFQINFRRDFARAEVNISDNYFNWIHKHIILALLFRNRDYTDTSAMISSREHKNA